MSANEPRVATSVKMQGSDSVFIGGITLQESGLSVDTLDAD